MAKSQTGFVSLQSLKQGTPDPAAALADIRKIYFKTTRQTIDNDLAHAIDLLMSLPSEEERERASVYMEGLHQMQREWQATARKKSGSAGKKSPRTAKKSPPGSKA